MISSSIQMGDQVPMRQSLRRRLKCESVQQSDFIPGYTQELAVHLLLPMKQQGHKKQVPLESLLLPCNSP